MKTPAWHQVEQDIRIGFAMVADLVWQITGADGRGEAAAKAVLGIDEAPGYLLADNLDDRDTLNSFDVENTEFFQVAKKAHRLVLPDQRLNDVDVSDNRLLTEQYLNYFIRAIPRDSVGAYDAPYLFQDPEGALQVLLAQYRAKLDLAEMVQELVTDSSSVIGVGFTPADVAALGQMNLRSVRNHFGPKGNKAIKSYVIGSSAERSDLVMGDPLDSLEWLAARRGFQPGGISQNWANKHLERLSSLEKAAAFAGVFAWCNSTTTEAAAQRLGWEPERFSRWVRSDVEKPGEAEKVASVIGLDPTAYVSTIERLLSD
ncbi:hypothetical protein [Shimia sp. MIT1388]|uniref:hypothetical protein n=1 Tax=Shimia sp. MIT1388 TaxID=3096992 RepID=UPI00399B809A